jgi:hypothetical protein
MALQVLKEFAPYWIQTPAFVRASMIFQKRKVRVAA